MRAEIRKEVELIEPLDEVEYESKRRILSWIDSGAEICRLQKPDVPKMHLVSYFAVVDGEYILHIRARTL